MSPSSRSSVSNKLIKDYPKLCGHPKFPAERLVAYLSQSSPLDRFPLKLSTLSIFSTPPLSPPVFSLFLKLWPRSYFPNSSLPKGLSPDQVEIFCNLNYPTLSNIPSSLLGDLRIPFFILKKLVESAPHVFNHEHICLNPNTSTELLIEIYNKQPVGFLALLRNPKTPEYIFLDILQNPNHDLKLILKELNQAKNLPDTVYEFLLTSPLGLEYLPSPTATPKWFLDKFISQKNETWIAENPQYFAFLDNARQNVFLNSNSLSNILKIVDSSTPLPIPLQERLTRYPDSRVQAALATRIDVSPATLKILSQSPSTTVRKAVAGNPNTPPDCLEVLCEDIDFDVLVSVINNPQTPSGAIEQLIFKHDFTQLSHTFSNPNFSERILDFFALKFASLPEPRKSSQTHSPLYYILTNPSLSRETREKLLYTGNPLVYEFMPFDRILSEKAYQLITDENSNFTLDAKQALYLNPSFPTQLAQDLIPSPSSHLKLSREESLKAYWDTVFSQVLDKLENAQILMLVSLMEDDIAADTAFQLALLASNTLVQEENFLKI